MEKVLKLAARQNLGRTPTVPKVFNSRGPYPSQAVRRPFWRSVVPGLLKRILTYAWAIEIASILIAILALSAIYITLVIHSDRPLPRWPGLISINSLIAIFTVILKAALIMPVAEGIGQLKWHWFHEPRSLIDLNRVDAASRGPWGSFLLIFTTPKHSLAVFGAFITVLALAVEPFSQQVIQYHQCLQNIPGSVASISKTNNYTLSSSGKPYEPKVTLPDNTMAAALYIGLIQPPINSTSSISFQCSTGNCTFPEDQGATHSSLAMCSSCTDISVTVKEQTFPLYSLKSGPSIGWTNHGKFQWMSTSAYTKDNAPEIDFISGFDALIYKTKTCTNGSIIGRHCGYEPFAVSCYIYPCMKTYRASVTNFVLEEKLLNTTRVPIQHYPTDNSSHAYGFTLLSSSVLRNGTWSNCVGADNPSEANPVQYPSQFKISSPDSVLLGNSTQSPSKYYPNNCFWIFYGGSAQALGSYLSNLFDGEILGPSSPPDEVTGTPWQMGLFSKGNATLSSASAYMEGLANAITSVIRQHGDTPSAEYAQGTAYGLQTCIKVKWTWLALPSALILLTIAFLLTTILETRSRNMTWKSSVLALLFHGLDTISRQQYGEMMDLGAMENAAEQVQAKLAVSESGLQFVFK